MCTCSTTCIADDAFSHSYPIWFETGLRSRFHAKIGLHYTVKPVKCDASTSGTRFLSTILLVLILANFNLYKWDTSTSRTLSLSIINIHMDNFNLYVWDNFSVSNELAHLTSFIVSFVGLPWGLLFCTEVCKLALCQLCASNFSK